MALPTTEEIEALENAIRSGTKTVSFSDRSVTYRDLTEMTQILSSMKEQLSESSAPFGVIQIYYSKGL